MKKIQVCGDPTVDWLWTRNPGNMPVGGIYFWQSKQSIPKLSLGSQPGGCLLMYNLLKEMTSGKADVAGIALDEKLLDEPKTEAVTESWTIWQAYFEKQLKKSVFRITEGAYKSGAWDYKNNRLTGTADLLMIEDSGLGFHDEKAGWPEALSREGKKPEHIIIKLTRHSSHGAANPLIKRIHDLGLGGNTTIVMAINDLRANAVRIGSSLSWEKLFDEVVDAVHSPETAFYDCENKQLLYGRVVISLGTSGAVIIGRDGNSLVFDRSGQEGDFSFKHPGEVMGYNTCLMCALGAGWAEQGSRIDWNEAVRAGIILARYLNIKGYGIEELGNRYCLQFPVKAVADYYNQRELNSKEDTLGIWDLGIYSEQDSEAKDKDRWSILEESVKRNCGAGATAKGITGAVCDCAKAIVKTSPREALKDVPIETVGAWSSADRTEIEGVRSVNNAFKSYLNSLDRQEKPLCIAVFGPPGAGKSFAIKEIAKGLGIEKESQLTFNLSQFESDDELPSAFHQIRDLQLKGRMPLVFWDEFDTPFRGRLGWLKYFLAPMQDGEFMEGGMMRPIGKCIFVFAGATSHSFYEFCAGGSQEELAAKKPDFISRLKAYIDIKGPNGYPNTIQDKLFIIRRAFLLNHFLNTYAPETNDNGQMQIEDCVLEAFLRIGSYRHGARSMEALIKMSVLEAKRKYEYSSLPPDQIMGMHVNTDKFLLLTKLGGRETMRIGVTGHINLPDERDVIKTCLENVIGFIEEHYPCRLYNVLSMLALGSDRLVANRILQIPGASLTAVLPVPKDDFINDFGATDNHSESFRDAENRQEFRYYLENMADEVIELPAAPTRNDAYLNTGCYIVDNCDLLIAVWDGRPAQGKGGAGDIALIAETSGKPIIHIWAGNNKSDPEKRTDVGDRLGKFRYKNIPGIADNW